MVKIKVLHIINNLEVGGAEIFLELLLREFKKNPGIKSTLISLEGHGPLENNIVAAGIKYKKFNYHMFLPIISRFDIGFRPGLLWFTLREKPDIIHGHLRSEIFAKFLGKMLSIPVVITRHDTLSEPTRKLLLFNSVVRKAVAVSPVVAKHLEKSYGFSKDKIEVIPDAIERARFLGCEKDFDPNNPVFIYSGRLYKTKGIEETIRAMAKLHKEIPGLKLYIYGKFVEQSYYDSWLSLVKKNGWDFVKFLGRTDDVPGALKNADIFILASKSEGFGMAPLEAATAGKPLILTKTGAMGEMIDEGKNGYFVKYGDFDGIYQAAKKILSGDVEAMGKYSRDVISIKFDISKVAEMYYNLYLQVKGK